MGWIGQLVVKLIGAGWALATFLVVPVMVTRYARSMIDLSTLAALHEHRHEIAAYCPPCDRWRELPLAELVAQGHGRAVPEFESLHAWLHKTFTAVSKRSELAVAIRFALSRRDDGRLELDNNSAARSLRAIALGRKG